MEKTCKTCKYAHFAQDPETGATSWVGRCLSRLLLGGFPEFRGQTIEQHFKCSNNKCTPR